MSRIRVATIEDVPQLVEMGDRFLSLLYADVLTPNRDSLAMLSTSMVDRPGSMVLVAEDGSLLIGMIALHIFDHPMSGERMASEIAWWVEPEARGIGMRLYKAAEIWAKTHGATSLQMVAPNEKVAAFYERLGFQPVETTYQRRLN